MPARLDSDTLLHLGILYNGIPEHGKRMDKNVGVRGEIRNAKTGLRITLDEYVQCKWWFNWASWIVLFSGIQ